eukprot:Skav208712  [mRNA]  locus=scaffold42:749345:752980:+ [translate_table: standard]
MADQTPNWYGAMDPRYFWTLAAGLVIFHMHLTGLGTWDFSIKEVFSGPLSQLAHFLHGPKDLGDLERRVDEEVRDLQKRNCTMITKIVVHLVLPLFLYSLHSAFLTPTFLSVLQVWVWLFAYLSQWVDQILQFADQAFWRPNLASQNLKGALTIQFPDSRHLLSQRVSLKPVHGEESGGKVWLCLGSLSAVSKARIGSLSGRISEKEVSSALRAATACVAADPVPQTCGAAPGKEAPGLGGPARSHRCYKAPGDRCKAARPDVGARWSGSTEAVTWRQVLPQVGGPVLFQMDVENAWAVKDEGNGYLVM